VQNGVEPLGERGVVLGQTVGDVRLDKREGRRLRQVGDVLLGAGHEVVHRHDRAATGEEGVNQV